MNRDYVITADLEVKIIGHTYLELPPELLGLPPVEEKEDSEEEQ